MNSTLPDFVGIGALKSGTSYLDALLREHPELSLPTRMKEVDYFTVHHERGAGWYAAQFAAVDGRLRGEFSPRYLGDPRCARRIAELNPAAKLVISVRHPVERIHSQYRHWKQETGYAEDFATFVGEHPGAVQRSLYWDDLQHYLEAFPRTQVHLLVFEELIARPESVLPEVLGYLGVDQQYVPGALHVAVNASGTPRFPRVYVNSKRVSRWLYRRGAGGVVKKAKATGVARVLRSTGRAPEAERASAEIPVDLGRELADRLRPDAEQLSTWLGRDLVSMWGL